MNLTITILLFCLIISSTAALSLLDLHDDQIPLRTYSKDNVQNNDDGTISFKEYGDYDTETIQRGIGARSKSIPLIEAPVAMSNPIWKIFSRASDLYRIFRRSSNSINNRNAEFSNDSANNNVISSPFSLPSYQFAKKVTRNPKGFQLFL
uniref:Uncharacterized protein n=1 Tax=Panagrolaimus superbus TaxID=310955 RepID=A0A914YYR0_9BILA